LIATVIQVLLVFISPQPRRSLLANAKVLAENAHTGIWGIPGRNSGAMNIEVHGGKNWFKNYDFLSRSNSCWSEVV